MMKKYDDDLFKRPHTHTPLTTQSNSSQQSLVVKTLTFPLVNSHVSVSQQSLVVKTLTFPLVSSSSQ